MYREPDHADARVPDTSWLREFESSKNVDDGDAAAQIDERVTGRLNASRAIDTMWRRATSKEWIHEARTNGYCLPLRGGVWPDSCFFPSRRMNPEHEAFVDKAVAELERFGCVCAWDDMVRSGIARGDRPHCVMPLLVAPKSSGGFRLIHDGRHLNKFLLDLPFNMKSVREFIEQLRQGDRMFVIDITSAYHHIGINRRFWTLIAFEWRGRFYCYCCLPFGIKCSAFVFCQFAGITADYVRATGLTTALTQYVDDFLGSVGQTPDFGRLRKVVRIFQYFGWLLQFEKLDLRLATRIKGLGFMLDSGTMTVGVPEKRRLKLQDTAKAVLAQRQSVRVRDLCKLIGQIVSLELALGIICRIRSRYLLLTVAAAARVGNYSLIVSIRDRALSELRLWAGSLSHIPERPMRASLRPPDVVIESDASDHALGAIVTECFDPSLVNKRIWRRLLPNEVAWGSTLREMTGYNHATEVLSRLTNLRGKVILIVGDAQSARFVFAKGGSQVVDNETGLLLITETLLDILSDSVGFETFHWKPREELTEVDALSKMVDRHDFGLRPAALKFVRKAFGSWDVDRFAAEHNATCPRFDSRLPCRSCEHADTFRAVWSGDVNFVLPPFHALGRVLTQIESHNARAILIIPEWPSTAWWRRVWSGAWAPRVRAWRKLPPDSLISHNGEAFFSDKFNACLFVLDVWPLA